jgi:hypothetical protein
MADVHTMLDEPGLRLGIAEGALVVAVGTTSLAALPVDVALLPAAAVVLLAARALPLGGACCLALSAWAFVTGFVENSLGQLTLAPADLARLAVLLLTGLVPAAARQGRHWAGAR